jgi:hypothetical protein
VHVLSAKPVIARPLTRSLACSLAPHSRPRPPHQVSLADEYVDVNTDDAESAPAADATKTPAQQATGGGVGGGCPEYIPTDNLTKDFLPTPENRLVPELSSAGLHELRKDTKALRERFEHISGVLQVKHA